VQRVEKISVFICVYPVSKSRIRTRHSPRIMGLLARTIPGFSGAIVATHCDTGFPFIRIFFDPLMGERIEK